MASAFREKYLSKFFSLTLLILKHKKYVLYRIFSKYSVQEITDYYRDRFERQEKERRKRKAETGESFSKGLEILQSHVSRGNDFFAFSGMLFQRVFFVQNKIVLSRKTM